METDISSLTSIADLNTALLRRPKGTVSLLFRKVPLLEVPPAWRRLSLDLHLGVDLLATDDGMVAAYAPMRRGLAARLLGGKVRLMGVLPDYAAETVLQKLSEGARIRARLVDAPPPQLRGTGADMGFFLSIRCKS